MREDLICAGFGGQGIMMLGKLIAYSAMRKGLNVTWMPSYGAEVRGGTAHSMVVISDSEIASPIVSSCNTAIIMNKPSLDKFLPQVKKGGLLILNSSLADDNIKRRDITVLKIPMTENARKLGNVRVANMIALGCYMNTRRTFTKDIVAKGINIAFSGKKDLIDINVKALEEGLKIR